MWAGDTYITSCEVGIYRKKYKLQINKLMQKNIGKIKKYTNLNNTESPWVRKVILLQGSWVFVLHLINSEAIQTLCQFDFVVQVNDVAHGPLVLPRVTQVFP